MYFCYCIGLQEFAHAQCKRLNFFFALFTDKVINRKQTTTLYAVTCCWLYVCVCARVSVTVLGAHMSGSYTGDFYMSWGRGEISCYVFGEIKGGNPWEFVTFWVAWTLSPPPGFRLSLIYYACGYALHMYIRRTDWHRKTSLYLPVPRSTCWWLLNVSIRKHKRYGLGLHRKQWWVSVCPPHIIFWCQGQQFFFQNCN
jgi:hypothetical protein